LSRRFCVFRTQLDGAALVSETHQPTLPQEGSMYRSLPLLLLTFAATPVALAAPSSDPGAVLDASRRAAGKVPAAGTLQLHYGYEADGLHGTVEDEVDLDSGAFVERYELGPTRGSNGFDGQRAWMVELSGTALPQDGGDRPALAVNDAYRLANLWWRKDYGGARVELLGREEGAAHLRVSPRGGKPFEAWFDAHTRHLTRVRETRGFQTVTTTYKDYAAQNGFVLPRTIEIDTGAGEPQKLQLRRVTRAPRRSAETYAMPTARPDDHAIDGGGASVTVPMRLFNNHIFVDARIDGRGPFALLVDTGGHDIVTPSTVAALGLRTQGAGVSAGAGEATAPTGYTRLREIEVGGVRLHDQTVLTLDFSPTNIEGFQVGGMLGLEFFQRYVVTIDYAAGRLTMTDPARFDASQAGTKVPFRFYDHMPQVEGDFAGIPALYNIDTGSRAEVTMTKPFVERHGLRATYTNGVTAVDGWGVGGRSISYVTRVDSLRLGQVPVARPVAGLATQARGVFSDANYDGNVGSGLLKRFTVTFDYARQAMYLKPASRPDEDVGSFDRSGMWLNMADAGFEIMDVAAGSPAAQAGLAVGDVVTRIGGDDVHQLGLSEVRRRLRIAEPGRPLELDVLRKGEARRVTLVPRDQV
jgi:PDZ domain/Aspartyl protease